MSETLGQKQRRFSKLYAQLILKAYELGYECALGEVERSDEQAEINALGLFGRNAVADLIQGQFPELAMRLRNNGKTKGIRHSVHQFRLAGDVFLFKNGVYLQDSADYRALGEWWEKQAPDCRWGGRFNDGNHFSIEYNGVK